VSSDDPERVRVVGATELERKLLAAAGAELPDPELRARMARAIGLSGVATSAAAPASGGSSAGGATLSWPVISASVAALALTGAAIGYTSHRAEREMPAEVAARPAPLAPASPLPPPVLPVATAAPAARVPAPAPRPRRSVAAAPVSDLRGEIALLDAVRAAVAAGSDARALALLRRYEARYPTGTFRPEATALRIEVLARLGQTRQAEALGADFLAAHPDSPLAARVRRALGR